MQQQVISANDTFPYVRVVMGMVIGLGLTRLLPGIAHLPSRYQLDVAHLSEVLKAQLAFVHRAWLSNGVSE